MTIDFEVLARVSPTTSEEVSTVLRDLAGSAVRIAGRSSTQHRVPAPKRPVTLVEFSRLDRILRLEPGDLTCSVEAGVTLPALRAALDEHALCLPITGDGTTVGGVFARGDSAPLVPGGHSTRTVILGVEAVLAEGLPFRAGARVVKSVAGFDLQRLFIGSRGRLFAVTALHLKLRPKLEHVEFFAEPGLERTRAIERFVALRRAATAPAAIVLTRDRAGAFTVSGSFGGRARVVAQQIRNHDLRGVAAAPCWSITPADAREETLRGCATSSALGPLCDALPPDAPMQLTGGGQLDVVTGSPDRTDRVLREFATLGIKAEVYTASAERRGLHTEREPNTAALERDLRRALDPREMLS